MKKLMMLNAVLAGLAGIALALWGPILMDLYHFTALPDEYMQAHWTAASFARMFGVALFCLGVLLWVGRRLAEMEERSVVAAALMGAYGLGSGLALVQQITIWGSWIGWVTVGLGFLLTLGYGACLVSRFANRPEEVRQIFAD